MPAKGVSVDGHGEWVVDGVSCRDHYKHAKAYKRASQQNKGRALDEVVAVTGWSRDDARRRLTAAASQPPGSGRQVAKTPRRRRVDKFSYDARLVLHRVWAASGGQCGKYLAASMQIQRDALERHDELVDGRDRYSPAVREELLAMSAATIDRYLAPVKAVLLKLAKDRTEQLSLASFPTALPDVRKGIRVRAAG